MAENTDILDIASAREEQERAGHIAAASALALKSIPSSPNCLHCGEAISNGSRWCDSQCRDNWQTRLAAAARNGRP